MSHRRRHPLPPEFDAVRKLLTAKELSRLIGVDSLTATRVIAGQHSPKALRHALRMLLWCLVGENPLAKKGIPTEEQLEAVRFTPPKQRKRR